MLLCNLTQNSDNEGRERLLLIFGKWKVYYTQVAETRSEFKIRKLVINIEKPKNV